MGEGVVVGVLDALITDFTAQARPDLTGAMATVTMREIREGEVPFDGGTAVQEDPDRPAFRGNGPDDYVCVKCGNVLAESMHEEQMTYKVRVRCGVCRTVNVSATDVARPEPAQALGAGRLIASTARPRHRGVEREVTGREHPLDDQEHGGVGRHGADRGSDHGRPERAAAQSAIAAPAASGAASTRT